MSISAQESIICKDHSVVLVANGIPKNSEYNWNLGPWTIKNDQDTVRFAAVKSGNFKASLNVKTPSGLSCFVRLKNEVTVVGRPDTLDFDVSTGNKICELPKKITIDAKGGESDLSYTYIIETLGDASKDYLYRGKSKNSSVTHTLNYEGYKKVVLEIENASGCKTLISKDSLILADNLEKPAFSYKDPLTCDEKTIDFTLDNGIESGIQYVWKFEKGTPSTAQLPEPRNIKFDNLGSFDVSVTASNGKGCKATYESKNAIKVGTQVPFDIEISKSEICRGDEVVLRQTGSDLSAGKISWKLLTGDVDLPRSNDQLKRVSFIDQGFHSIGLSHSFGGCVTEVFYEDTIQTHRLTSRFSAPSYCDCEPGKISFINESFSSDPTAKLQYEWKISQRGNVIHTDTNENLAYEFDSYGEYKVQLIVKSSNGCTGVFHRDIRFAPLKTVFELSNDHACLGQIISGTINTTKTCLFRVQSIEWKIYDEDKNVVAQYDKINFSHKFSKPGKYDVGLKIINAKGCQDEVIQKNAIDVFQIESKVITDKEFLCINDSVTVKVSQGPYIVSANHKWLIIDPISKARNTGFGNSLEFPISRAGTYDIHLTSSLNEQCADTVLVKDAFKVSGVEADIYSSIRAACLPLNSELGVTVDKNIHHINPSSKLLYRWSLVDSANTKIFSPNTAKSKVYIDKAGAYDAYLSITNSDGCTSVISKKHALLAGVVSRFNANPVACLNVPFNVSNKSYVNPTSFEWTVSDPSIEIKPNAKAFAPNFIFTELGNYTLSLITKNDLGCVDTFKRNVKVIDFDFSFTSEQSKSVLCAPALVTFEVEQTNVDSFYWDFGDNDGLGITATEAAHFYDILDQNPNKEYPFDVSLIAFSNYGCSDTFTREDYIRLAGPRPKFIADPLTGTESLEVDFFDLNEGVSHYLFDYGDNSSIDSSEMNTHTYTILDTTKLFEEYYPKMVAFDPKGCKRTFLGEPIKIFNQAIARFSADTLEACDSIEIKLSNFSVFADSFAWYLDNSDTAFSYDREPEIALFAGEHTITLEAFNLVGSSHRNRKEQYIVVHQKPTVAINLSHTFLCTEKEINLSDASVSKNDIVKWLWDFDPANPGTQTDSLEITKRVYTEKGGYSVELKVTDIFGCENTRLFSDTIQVGEPQPILHQGLSFVSFDSEDVLSTSIDDSDTLAIKGFFIYEMIDNEPKTVQPLNQPQNAILKPGSYQFRLNNDEAVYQLMGIDQCDDTVAIGNMHYPVFLNIDTSTNFLPRLNWNAYAGWNGVKSYEVLRAEYGGSLKTIATLPGGTTTYIDSQVCGTKYEYLIRAHSEKDDYSARSTTDTISPNYIPPTGQTDLLFTTVVDNKYVLTTWRKDKHPTIGYYRISRTDPNFGFVAEHTTVTDTFYLDSIEVFTDRDVYAYEIEAVDFCKNTTQPSIQGNSIVCAVERTENHTDIEWNLFEEWPINETTYFLERSTGNDDFTPILEGKAITYFRDEEVFINEEDIFHYRIKAVYGEHTVYSNAVKEFPDLKVYVPNAFTPNNDGINDEFVVFGSGGLDGKDENVDNFEMKILNRWGEIVYQSNAIDKGWDGRFKGEDSPAGTYVCQIEFRNKKGQFTYHAGNLVLIR